MEIGFLLRYALLCLCLLPVTAIVAVGLTRSSALPADRKLVINAEATCTSASIVSVTIRVPLINAVIAAPNLWMTHPGPISANSLSLHDVKFRKAQRGLLARKKRERTFANCLVIEEANPVAKVLR